MLTETDSQVMGHYDFRSLILLSFIYLQMNIEKEKVEKKNVKLIEILGLEEKNTQ